MTSVLLRTIRSQRGEPGVRELLAQAGVDHEPAFLDDVDNWVSLAEAVALLEAGVTVTGDPALPERVGAETVRQHAGTQVATLLRSLGSPEAILDQIATTAAKLSTVSDLHRVEAEPGRAVVRAVARPGFERHPLHCAWTRGLLSGPCALFGLTAGVEEVECQARGGAECRYVVTWDPQAAAAAGDPEEHVRALEAQVAALAQRLENAYATASDLVSPDDLDTVLVRIISRAAGAVRAPGYVLVVSPDPQGPPRVFSDGVARAEAELIAFAPDDADADRDHDHDHDADDRGQDRGHGHGDDERAGSTRLAVKVASSRRDYGRLVAVLPEGMHFFPQERQLLTLYARHAAAVLDTAMALDESLRRQRHLSDLLTLATTLARAGSTEEVARRLVDSVSSVVDCDRAAVWVWDNHDERLRRVAMSSPAAEQQRDGIRLKETPHLERMLKTPQPMFFDRSEPDPVLKTILVESGQVALAVVPVLAHEGFVGLLAVSVTEGAERLAPSSGLLEKLTGVAALAAPALQNGRLIDELDRQVVHDELTGILNRTGFLRSVEGVLDRLATVEGLAGLLFVDLDEFKLLNDRHGHHFGDVLLCQVATRLRRLFREDDSVARLGGDEFAVILPGVADEDDLRRAADRARAAFADPFRVEGREVRVAASIGCAIAPQDGSTVDALVRRADSSMYREKERAHGRRAMAV